MSAIEIIEREQLRTDLPEFWVGDTVDVHTKIVEGDTHRIQIFRGVVIAFRRGGINASYTVRKISYGEGVEKVFPYHTPLVAKVEVVRKGSPRRAKLNYLRGRVGKGALFVKENKRAKAASSAE